MSPRRGVFRNGILLPRLPGRQVQSFIGGWIWRALADPMLQPERLCGAALCDYSPVQSMLRHRNNLRGHCATLLVLILVSSVAHAADSRRDPMEILNSLADRIYVSGETTGKAQDMIAAEAGAADEIRQYIAGGSTEGLLAKDKGEQSALTTAAYMGYPNVVAALLTSKLVRAHINDADAMGLTPWVAANLSMKQALWTCNPAAFDDPYKFVTLFVTQPYYLTNPTPPYMKTREVLEKAGAATDMAKAKEVWLTNCKNQSEETKAKVRASADLQKTVQELVAADLAAQLVKLQKKAAEAQKQ
jgi:hypothetical protein